MIFGGVNLRWRIWVVAVLGFCALPEAYAAFNGFMPLAHSGQVSYSYGYADNGSTQSESAILAIGWDASGYIWRPWFATTSLALNVGLTRADTNTSSSEGTSTSGGFSLGVFPHSRFPFTLDYSRSDSRSQQYQDISQVTGDTSFQVTRLTLRQRYQPRAYNQIFNGWYSSTQFGGGAINTDTEGYGLDYDLRVAKQTLGLSASHSGTKAEGSLLNPTTDAISLNHVYTPSGELGVNSLVSYVEADSGGSAATSIDTQAFSAFYWRPEHRAVSVSGGVRLAENKSEGATDSLTRSLSTNLGLGYRITRALNASAAATVGTSDNETSQTLSTTQTVSLSYNGSHYEWDGYSYTWNWSSGASNATVRTEQTGGLTTSTDQQSVNMGIGHNLGKSWSVAKSSMQASFSQSVTGSKNSETDIVGSSLNHGMSVGMNSRGKRGSTYINARLSDSRSFGEQDTVFDNLGVTYSADISFNRLSSMSGNMNFSASRNESENELGGTTTTTTKSVFGNLSYQHGRPFGIYNLRFTTNLLGSRQLDSPTPSSTLRSESVFRYSLGQLSTSLSLRLSESAGGALTKSMNFQATRSF